MVFFRWLASWFLESLKKGCVSKEDYERLDINPLENEKYLNRLAWGLLILASLFICFFIFLSIENFLEGGIKRVIENAPMQILMLIFLSPVFICIIPIILPSKDKMHGLYVSELNRKTTQDILDKAYYANKKKEDEENHRRIKQAEDERIRKIKQAEDEAYSKRLQEIEDIEAAKARGQAKGLAELYRHQIELLVEYKKRGADIDKEVFDMREKLLVMERQENNFMIQDLLKTLDSI
jgi:hypothetical protein